MSKSKNFPTVSLKEVPLAVPENSHPYRPVVLVVDDESVIADTLAEILTRSGYRVSNLKVCGFSSSLAGAAGAGDEI